MTKSFQLLSDREIDRIIEMAWEDRTTFEAIEFQFMVSEAGVIEIMCRDLNQEVSGSGEPGTGKENKTSKITRK